MEAPKIYIASVIAGGQTILTKQQDCACKFARMVTLPKTRLLNAIKNAMPILTPTLQHVVALLTVQLCTNFSNMMRLGRA